MEFSRELRADVLSGDITVTFRRGKRPQVKAGGRYRVGSAQIEVDSIELVPFAAIDETDLLRTGEADLQSLRRRAAHTGPIQHDTLLGRGNCRCSTAAISGPRYRASDREYVVVRWWESK